MHLYESAAASVHLDLLAAGLCPDPGAMGTQQLGAGWRGRDSYDALQETGYWGAVYKGASVAFNWCLFPNRGEMEPFPAEAFC